MMMILSMLCFPGFLTVSYRFPWCFHMFLLVFLWIPLVFPLFPVSVSAASSFRFCGQCCCFFLRKFRILILSLILYFSCSFLLIFSPCFFFVLLFLINLFQDKLYRQHYLFLVFLFLKFVFPWQFQAYQLSLRFNQHASNHKKGEIVSGCSFEYDMG